MRSRSGPHLLFNDAKPEDLGLGHGESAGETGLGTARHAARLDAVHTRAAGSATRTEGVLWRNRLFDLITCPPDRQLPGVSGQ